MEIFITLTKYNTYQRREEGNQLLVVYYLVSILPVFATCPTKRASAAQRFFKGRSRRRAVAQTRTAGPKMFLKRCQAIKLAPPMWVRAWRGGPWSWRRVGRVTWILGFLRQNTVIVASYNSAQRIFEDLDIPINIHWYSI